MYLPSPHFLLIFVVVVVLDFLKTIKRISAKFLSAGPKLLKQFTEESSINNQQSISTEFFSAFCCERGVKWSLRH